MDEDDGPPIGSSHLALGCHDEDEDDVMVLASPDNLNAGILETAMQQQAKLLGLFLLS